MIAQILATIIVLAVAVVIVMAAITPGRDHFGYDRPCPMWIAMTGSLALIAAFFATIGLAICSIWGW